MHALALHLQQQGYVVSGSDDRITEPARGHLAKAGLLPPAEGWFPEKIQPNIDLVIVGMHARPDNPELRQARALGRVIWDMPTYLARATTHKHRIVVAGSHGKTTTTAFLIQAFQTLKLPTDWLIGARALRIPQTLRLSEAPTCILEGDEYPASPDNPQPKAAVYQPHWLILTGIAWDHANVYPTPEHYQQAFEHILQTLPKGGVCFYYSGDPLVKALVEKWLRPGWHYLLPYSELPATRKRQTWMARIGSRLIPVRFWGRHNLQNAAAVWRVLQELSVSEEEFAGILSELTLPDQRQEIWLQTPDKLIVRDFAHAPSKVEATLRALRETFPRRSLLAVLELHTYSSLQPSYAAQYRHALRWANTRWIYVDPLVATQKGSELEVLRHTFPSSYRFFSNAEALRTALQKVSTTRPTVIALLSSGTLGGIAREEFS